MDFLKKYYFQIIGSFYLLFVFLFNLSSINNIFILYFSIILFCLVIRFDKNYGIIISNTIFTFIVLQIFVPISYFFDVNFRTLRPNLRTYIEIDTSLLRGLDEEIFIGTDGRGFRSLHSKNTYKKKLYLVGGSTTEQLYISDDKTTAGVLEELLVNARHSVNVVNTGLSGLRALHHASTIRHTQSDNAVGYIILVGVNDWNHLLRSEESNWKTSFLFPRNWLLTRAARRLRDIFGEKYGTAGNDRETDPNSYYQAVMNLYQGKPKVDFEIGQEHKDYYSAEIRKIEDACENLPGEQFCVFVTQPHGYYPANFENEEYVRSLWMTPPNTDWALPPESLIRIANEFNRLLEDSVDCRNCYVLKLDEVFGGSTAYLYDDVHFNNEGALLFAESAFGFLNDNELLDF